MTTLPVNYSKPIMVELLNSQSQAWEMMLSQNTMCQPIIALGSDAILACNAVSSPHKRACRSSEQQEGRGERVETYLVP